MKYLNQLLQSLNKDYAFICKGLAKFPSFSCLDLTKIFVSFSTARKLPFLLYWRDSGSIVANMKLK